MAEAPARLGAVRACGQLLRAQARSQLSYRASFAMDVFSNVWATVFDVLAVLVLFRVTAELGGFSAREALVMVGIATAGFTLADLAVGNIDHLRFYVRTGLLDALLVRPLGVLSQLLAMDMPLRKVARVGFAVAVLAVALARAPIEWTPARIALAVVAPAAGTVFFAALFVATATVAFWWIESGEMGNALTYGGRDLTAYPLTIYSGWFRSLFGLGLGFGFVAYFPALALLGRADPLGLPGWLGWASPAVALVAAAVAAAIWRLGVRRYAGTGS